MIYFFKRYNSLDDWFITIKEVWFSSPGKLFERNKKCITGENFQQTCKNQTIVETFTTFWSLSKIELNWNIAPSVPRSVRRVNKVDFEKCRNKLTKCLKIKCSTEFDPVCGTDARTYTNQCQLNLATCLKGVQFAHIGNCTKLKEEEPCPADCENEADEEPVCGSDGNVYRYVRT